MHLVRDDPVSLSKFYSCNFIDIASMQSNSHPTEMDRIESYKYLSHSDAKDFRSGSKYICIKMKLNDAIPLCSVAKKRNFQIFARIGLVNAPLEFRASFDR